MSRAEELAQAYADAVSTHRLESLYGTSKSYTLEKARERDEAHAALSAELRRLSAVEAELEAEREESKRWRNIATWEKEIRQQAEKIANKSVTELEALKKANSVPDVENILLRQMLAIRVSGAALYSDDGELQDNSTHPCIDFKRDPAELIHYKLKARLSASPAPAQQERKPMTDEEIRAAVINEGMMFTYPDLKIARAVERHHGIKE